MVDSGRGRRTYGLEVTFCLVNSIILLLPICPNVVESTNDVIYGVQFTSALQSGRVEYCPPNFSPPSPLTTNPPMRLSGLQREVLSLYRSCLREARNKPIVSMLLPRPAQPESSTPSFANQTVSRRQEITLDNSRGMSSRKVWALGRRTLRP
jgi:hypothetical protein